MRHSCALSPREYRSKVGLAEDSRDLLPLISLNLDLAVLHRATRAASLLHRLGQLLLFRQTDADKALHHRHRLAAAPGRLPDNVHSATVFPRRFGFRSLTGIRWRTLGWRR